MMASLQYLVAEAVRLGGGDLCAAGHDWQSSGGRTCPKYESANCSQSVYVCARCGVYDYGEKGSLSHRECFIECKRNFKDEIADDNAEEQEAQQRYNARITQEQEQK